jgi:hypothetical protein
MTRRELLLAVLASGKGRPFNPVQIQKAVFPIVENLPHLVHSGPGYNFQPYNCGPFDRDVYVEAESLEAEGSAIIAAAANGRWRTYAASAEGVRRGEMILERLSSKSRRYIESVAEWAQAQSFGSLVKSIYDAYRALREENREWRVANG